MQVLYKAVIFHLQHIRRRIIKLHTNTADICINTTKIQQLCQFKSHIMGEFMKLMVC
jgi:hypothetical protein